MNVDLKEDIKTENEDEKKPQTDKVNKRKKKWEKKMRFQPQNVLLKDDKDNEYYKKLLSKTDCDGFEVPRTISVYRHVEETSNEIKAMIKATKQHSGAKTALQCLPRHMRRRSSSHNIKRLPKSIHNLAKLQMENSNSITKIIPRKKRRKNLYLQNEYAEREAKSGWLETHLWYAKRFTMTSADDEQYKDWGVRVPLCCNNNNFRASYRDVVSHCLIQDVSYMKCLILEGLSSSINRVFNEITLKSNKPFIETLDEFIEVEKTIYDNSFEIPQCIGPALFSKHLEDDLEASKIKLMIWLHPLIHQQVIQLLQKLLESIFFSFRDFSDKLNRFRLVGPKSSVVSLSVLNLFKSSKRADDEESEERCQKLRKWISLNTEAVDEQNLKFRFQLAANHKNIFKRNQEKRSDNLAVNGSMLSAIIDDPRLTLPLNKEMRNFSSLSDLPEDDFVAGIEHQRTSPLLQEDILDEVIDSCLPYHVVSTRKNELRICGDDRTRQKWISSLSTPIPVILIHKCSDQTSEIKQEVNKKYPHRGPPASFASGYDLIIPTKWSMTFWISYIYQNARSAAYREDVQINLERKKPHFPEDYPDTASGIHWWKCIKEKNCRKYHRKPPAKRLNYAALSIPFPFAPNWNHIFSKNDSNETLKLDNKEDEKIRVIRDSHFINSLLQILDRVYDEDNIDKLTKMVESQPGKSLICVKLTSFNKGVPSKNVMITLPKLEDLLKLRNQIECIYGKGIIDGSGPVEAQFLTAKQRKKNNRKRKRKKEVETEKPDKVAELEEFLQFPFRDIIGFVTSGSFLQSYAKAGGIGFISLQSVIPLVKILKENSWIKKVASEDLLLPVTSLLAIFRVANSAQYRFVFMEPYIE